MKASSTFLAILALALTLPLAVLAQPDAPLQTNIQTKAAQRAPQPLPRGYTYTFSFPGGTPRQLLEALEKPFSQLRLELDPSRIASHYHWSAGWQDRLQTTEKQCRDFKVDWLSIASIAPEMNSVSIPALRVYCHVVFLDGRLIRSSQDASTRDLLNQAIALYNHLGQAKPEVGRLAVEGDVLKPSIVLLFPEKAAASAQPQVTVKAFPLKGIPGKDWDQLQKDIYMARDEGQKYADHIQSGRGSREFSGSVWFHGDTQLLVATGSGPFVEMAESIVAAHQANQRIAVEPAPSPPPVKK